MDYFIDVTPLPGPANLFRDYGHESWDEIIEPTTDFAGCDTSIPLPCGPAGLLEH